jgi:hypothetical protein
MTSYLMQLDRNLESLNFKAYVLSSRLLNFFSPSILYEMRDTQRDSFSSSEIMVVVFFVYLICKLGFTTFLKS